MIKPNLLIVDDEQYISIGLKMGIDWKKIGIGNVITAGDGQEALKILEEQQIHIMISDIMMGGMDGIELGNRVAKLYPDVKIILLTGYSEFSYAQQAIKFGAVDYMLKPVKINELIKRVSDIVHKCKMEDQDDFAEWLEDENIDGISKRKGLIQHQRLFGNDEKMSLINHNFSTMTLMAIDYVNTNYKKSLSVEMVASYVKKSNNYFSSQFKKELGIPFVEYVCRVKVEMGKLLLEQTTMMTYEIADILGFNDYKYFSTVFKKNVGVSPSQYKKSIVEK